MSFIKQFYSKYLAVYQKLILSSKKKYLFSDNSQIKTFSSKKKLKLQKRLLKLKFLSNRRLVKRLKVVFNSIYSPRYLSYYKVLLFQKQLYKFKNLYKRLFSLINLNKIFLARRLRNYIKNKRKLNLKKRVINYIVTISFRRNNIFCTFSKKKKRLKLIFAKSAGTYKINFSKKTFKLKSRSFLNLFFKEVNDQIKPVQELEKYKVFAQKQLKKQEKKLAKKAKNIISNKKKKLTKKQKQAIKLKNSLKKLRYISRLCLYGKICAPKRFRKNLMLRFLKLYKRIRYVRNMFVNVIEKKIFNGCRPKKKRRKKRQGLRVFR